jgi:predicted nucleic acid-binding protein
MLIRALLPGSPADKRLRQWLRGGEDLGISSIAWAEFLCGPLGPGDVIIARDLFREITAFTPSDCETTARLFNLGGRRRGTLADCMIAATALRAGAALATTNADDFARFSAASLTIVSVASSA